MLRVTTTVFFLLYATFLCLADDGYGTGSFSHGRHNPPRITPDQVQELKELHGNFSRGHSHHNGKRAVTAKSITPSQIRSFYNVQGDGAGQTVAIVVAYGASTVESDLAAFSNKFSLPACTISNGCFKKVNQNGGSAIPNDDPKEPPQSSWSGETNLDVQWVHAMAPLAKIVLVCANSPGSSDLFTAVRTAVSLSPIVSMSWGGSEGTRVSAAAEAIFTDGLARGVSFFAASGDDGAAAGYPASSPNVISVGGTTTYQNSDGSLATETAWSGSSGGCSGVYSMNAAQKSNAQAVARCGTKRATPDISANANPASGAPVYLRGSWYQFGGTSLATPLVAGRLAATRSQGSARQFNAAYAYGTAGYRDVTAGSNDNFMATTGFDLTTGLGVWVSEGITGTEAPSSTKAPTTSSSTTRATSSSSTTRSTSSSSTTRSTSSTTKSSTSTSSTTRSPSTTSSTSAAKTSSTTAGATGEACPAGHNLCRDPWWGATCVAVDGPFACVPGDDGQGHLCPRGTSACGRACYPASWYNCINGRLHRK